MTDNELKRYQGERHTGPANSAPYPVSRMAPSTELVDLAAQIAAADNMLANVTHGKLRQIAEQIQGLQQQARTILEASSRDQQLHRAQCNFQRKPGTVYHLYRRPDGRDYLSMLSPAEWGAEPPHEFIGSYRLESDMSWTPVAQLDSKDHSQELLERLLQLPE